MFAFLFFLNAHAQKTQDFKLLSPDGKIAATISLSDKITWTIAQTNQTILSPSPMAMTLENEILGQNPKLINAKTATVNNSFETPLYKKKSVENYYNQLVLNFKNDFSVEFRTFNDGVAYRFITKKKTEITVKNETANFNFDQDYKSLVPYVNDLRNPLDPYISSFEALYDTVKTNDFKKEALAFLPFLTDYDNNTKAVFLEADVENYPGMFVKKNPSKEKSLVADFAKFPLQEANGGYNNINRIVTQRADYLVKTSGNRTFPWRIVVISENDKDLMNNDMVQKLSAPSRIKDLSWIKPGKVAWDWWNDWNIYNVDFLAGINTQTYKYYIDFAAKNKLEYIIIDEGWSDASDLLVLSKNIDLKALLAYGKRKNVGIILWSSWFAMTKNTESLLKNYAAQGVKGFKIDFMDRDDAKMVTSLYEIAKIAADNKLILDYHGMYKPTGIQKTYPNILNFEGVKGLENSKWAVSDDVPAYDCTIPFIRMMAGPMDYTPGAMRNATKTGYRPSSSNPESQGTRCHQLALFTIFEAPLQMLADSPTAYMKEQECTDFIAQIPTTFDETIALDGIVGEYVAITRRKANFWYLGAITNWNSREITIDFSFLEKGKTYEATIFKDGLNADKAPVDYKKEITTVKATDKLTFRLANGGGLSAIIKPKS